MTELDYAVVLGDSIVKQVKNIRGAYVRSFRGDTIEDIKNHITCSGGRGMLMYKRMIFLHVGTNDLYTLSVEQMVDELKSLVQSITSYYTSTQKPVPLIFLSSIIPRPRDFWTTQPKILQYNKAVQRIEDEIGVRYIKTWHLFSRKGLPRKFMYSRDNLHPSKRGSTRLGRFISKMLNTYRVRMGWPKIKRVATLTRVTKKPGPGYQYPNERKRVKILFATPDPPSPEPTYGSPIKDVHKPRPAGEPRLTLKMKKKLKKAAEKERIKSTVQIGDQRIAVLCNVTNQANTAKKEEKKRKRQAKRKAKKELKKQQDMALIEVDVTEDLG